MALNWHMHFFQLVQAMLHASAAAVATKIAIVAAGTILAYEDWFGMLHRSEKEAA